MEQDIYVFLKIKIVQLDIKMMEEKLPNVFLTIIVVIMDLKMMEEEMFVFL